MKLRVQSLVRTIEGLGTPTGAVTPIEESRLAAMLAECLSDELAAPVLALLRHPNMHTRRVAIQAVRRAVSWSHDGIVAAVVERLSDAEAWVRYDAASCLGARRERSPEVVAALHTLAADAAPDDTLDLGDEEQVARVAAAKALKDIGAPPK